MWWQLIIIFHLAKYKQQICKGDKMINSVVIEGNLTHDPELRHVGSKGSATVTANIVCNYWLGAKQYATFVDVVLWGKKAENFCNYLKKGSRVMVKGILTNNTYTNKDGNKVSRMQIQVDDISFDPRKNNQYDPQTDNSIDEAETESQDDVQPENLPFY